MKSTPARDTVIFFSSDVHGSERCWLKFLNAAKAYGASILIMGGDITGKGIVPIVRLGSAKYQVDFMGRRSIVDDEGLGELKKRIRFNGFYPYVCEPAEVAALDSKPHLDGVFRTLISEQISRWMEIAADRLGPNQVTCFVMPGNDDEFFVDEVIAHAAYVINPDMKVVDVGDYQLLSCSWVPPTPWQSPRECSEEELSDRLNELASTLDRSRPTIVNLHSPPYRTGLDEAPQLNEDLSVAKSAGQAKMVPVGSVAVRSFIERLQPLVALHGHIHESRGITKLGATLCINPGSSYSEGTLDGCIVTLRGNTVRSTQLVRG